MKTALLTLALIAPALAAALAPHPASAEGAIALSAGDGTRYGYSYSYPSQYEADRRAIDECGLGCSVVAQFKNECAALATDERSGSEVYGWGNSSHMAGAQARALYECRLRAGFFGRCTVRAAACDVSQ